MIYERFPERYEMSPYLALACSLYELLNNCRTFSISASTAGSDEETNKASCRYVTARNENSHARDFGMGIIAKRESAAQP